MHAFPLLGHPAAPLFRTPERLVTGNDVLHAAHALAATLPPRPIINLCRDRLYFTVAFCAAVLRGQYSVLPGSHAAGPLAHLLACYPDAAIVTDTDLPPCPLPAGMPVIRLSTLHAGGAGRPANPDIAAMQVVAHILTSGSTGTPVAHAKTWGGLNRRAQASAGLFTPVPGRVATIVGTVPPCHMYGFETTVIQPLVTGCISTTGPALFPADIRTRLEQGPQPCILLTTPLHLRTFLADPTPLPPIARVISATAPLDAATAERAERCWQAPVFEIYGSTETGSIATRRTTATQAWRLHSGIRLHPRPDGTASIHAPDTTSHVVADALTPLTPDTFRLEGRMTDIIKIAGQRTSLAGLNAILLGLPGVEDGTFLAPAPDAAPGQPVGRMEVVVVAPTRTAPDILAELRTRVPPAFLPRRVVRVSVLPRNELGKLTRAALLALVHGPRPATEATAPATTAQEAGCFSIAVDHPALAGHFPGNPIVPGAVVLSEVFGLMGVEPARLEQIKFLRPVRPGDTVRVTHTAQPLAFTCMVGTQVVAKGRLRNNAHG
ncbi:AMP-binding protein [Komagataeibacter melomenusus]